MPGEAIGPVPVLVPIDHYTVHLGAFASRDPGRAPSQNMQIFLVPPLDHFVRNILGFFKVDVPPKLGWITGLRDSLVAFFPPDAFADFYSVLRAEKPVFAQYTSERMPTASKMLPKEGISTLTAST